MTAMGEKPGGAKVFFYSCIDGKDETEEVRATTGVVEL